MANAAAHLKDVASESASYGVLAGEICGQGNVAKTGTERRKARNRDRAQTAVRDTSHEPERRVIRRTKGRPAVARKSRLQQAVIAETGFIDPLGIGRPYPHTTRYLGANVIRTAPVRLDASAALSKRFA